MIDDTMDDEAMDDEAMNDDTIAGMTSVPSEAIPIKKSAAKVNDLSRQIERVVDREPLDWVRCVRVFGDFYRCNWWSRQGGKREGLDFDFGGLFTDHVRKSRFLRATMHTGQLVLDEVRDCGDVHPVSVEIAES